MHDVARYFLIAGLIMAVGGAAGAGLGSKLYGSLLAAAIGLLLAGTGWILLTF